MLAAGLAVCVTGCVADPPPPTVVGDERPGGERVGRTSDGVVLAVDRLDEGFNPHLLSDQGAETDLAAALTLPSAFRPGADGTPVMDTALLESAGPLPDSPQTVRYEIRDQAQWSDSAPVAAEDFEYLWRQMVTHPGVVDPEGYEHVVQVRSGAGGKSVDVVFDRPFPRWRSLFSGLLPAHLLKDSPEGFGGGMRGLPAISAGPFMPRSVDLGRGEVEFVRNDRYWEPQSGLRQIIVRRAEDAGPLGATLRSGPGSLALVGDTPVDGDVAQTVPGITTSTTSAAAQLELGFSTLTPAGAMQAVRRALAAAVHPAVVGRIVTGESDPGTSAFPFAEGTPETPTADPERVADQLSAAGLGREEGRWMLGGAPLSVTIGVDPTSESAVTGAYTVADQLRSAGIGARVWELDADALYGDAVPHGLVDAVVGWQRTDGDAVLAAASRFGCPASSPGATVSGPERPSRTATTVTTLQPPPPDSGAGSATTGDPDPSATSSTTSTTPRRAGAPGAPARGSAISGICDRGLQGALDRAGIGGDLRDAGRAVADLALRVPLVRPAHLVAVDAATTGVPVDRTGLTDTQLFDTAPEWRRSR